MALAYVYVRGNFADNVITTTKLVNNITFADGKAYKITLQLADNPKELLREDIITRHSNKYQRTQLEQS
jgi:hypothetical protein